MSITNTNTNTNTVNEANDEQCFKTVSFTTINQELMKKRLIKRLEEYGIDSTTLFEHLRHGNASIFGKFIFEIIHDEKYLSTEDHFSIHIKSHHFYGELRNYLAAISENSTIDERNRKYIFKLKNQNKQIVYEIVESLDVLINSRKSLFSFLDCSVNGHNIEFYTGSGNIIIPMRIWIDDWTDIKNKTGSMNIDINSQITKKDYYYIVENYDLFVKFNECKITISDEILNKLEKAGDDIIETDGLYAKKDYDGILKLFQNHDTFFGKPISEITIRYNSSENRYEFKFMAGDNSHMFRHYTTLDGLFGLIFNTCVKKIKNNTGFKFFTVSQLTQLCGEKWCE